MIRARENINIITQVSVHEHVCTYFLRVLYSYKIIFIFIIYYKCNHVNLLSSCSITTIIISDQEDIYYFFIIIYIYRLKCILCIIMYYYVYYVY